MGNRYRGAHRATDDGVVIQASPDGPACRIHKVVVGLERKEQSKSTAGRLDIITYDKQRCVVVRIDYAIPLVTPSLRHRQ